MRVLRDYLRVRVPHGLPPLGSEAEREPLLAHHAVTVAGRPWLLGMSTEAIRMRLSDLGRIAATTIREQVVKKEPNIERVGQLLILAHKLERVSPGLCQSQSPSSIIFLELPHSEGGAR